MLQRQIKAGGEVTCTASCWIMSLCCNFHISNLLNNGKKENLNGFLIDFITSPLPQPQPQFFLIFFFRERSGGGGRILSSSFIMAVGVVVGPSRAVGTV